MLFGNKSTLSESFGNKSLQGGLGNKHTPHYKKSQGDNYHHSVEETATISRDHGPGFMLTHKYKDNTHSNNNNGLEKTKREKKEDKNNKFH